MSNFSMPNTIIHGANSIHELGPRLEGMGKRCFIICGKSALKNGFVDSIKELLSEHCIEARIFAEVSGEPTDTLVERGAMAYRDSGCDFLIGIGGGSALDVMKAMGALVSYKCSFKELIGREVTISLPPMIAIPTTAGTGSEATTVCVITDTLAQKKTLIVGPSLLPDIAVVDPMFTLSAPLSVTVGTAIDALTHSIEAFTSRHAQPLSDLFAKSAILRIFGNLQHVLENPADLDSRYQLSLAAFEGGVAIENASVTLVHGLSRPIGALFHIPHGMANALLLEECMRFASPAVTTKLAEIECELEAHCRRFDSTHRKSEGKAFVVSDARNLMASENEPALADSCSGKSEADLTAQFLQRLHVFLEECNIPTIRSYGVDESTYWGSLEKMADDALSSGSSQNTWKAPTKQEIIEIYSSIWS